MDRLGSKFPRILALECALALPGTNVLDPIVKLPLRMPRPIKWIRIAKGTTLMHTHNGASKT